MTKKAVSKDYVIKIKHETGSERFVYFAGRYTRTGWLLRDLSETEPARAKFGRRFFTYYMFLKSESFAHVFKTLEEAKYMLGKFAPHLGIFQVKHCWIKMDEIPPRYIKSYAADKKAGLLFQVEWTTPWNAQQAQEFSHEEALQLRDLLRSEGVRCSVELGHLSPVRI